MSLSYTYNPLDMSSPLSKVYSLRLLLSDTDFSNIPTDLNPVPRAQQSVLFSDEEYQRFLADNNNDIMFTWSEVLLAIAANRAIMNIYVTLGGGGDVDFRQISSELRALSQQVLERYSEIPSENFSEVDTGSIAALRVWQNTVLRQLS